MGSCVAAASWIPRILGGLKMRLWKGFAEDADVRFRIKHDVPVFNRPFRDVAHEYLLTQESAGEVRRDQRCAAPKTPCRY